MKKKEEYIWIGKGEKLYWFYYSQPYYSPNLGMFLCENEDPIFTMFIEDFNFVFFGLLMETGKCHKIRLSQEFKTHPEMRIKKLQDKKNKENLLCKEK